MNPVLYLNSTIYNYSPLVGGESVELVYVSLLSWDSSRFSDILSPPSLRARYSRGKRRKTGPAIR